MKPHPRIRKTIKWGSAAATALLVVVWIGSAWCSASWASPHNFQVGIWRGRLTVTMGRATHDPLEQNWFDVTPRSGGFFWTANWVNFPAAQAPWGPGVSTILVPTVYVAEVPLWPVVAAALVITTVAWHLDRIAWLRAHPHVCRKCGYNRAGIAANAVCPECGERPTVG